MNKPSKELLKFIQEYCPNESLTSAVVIIKLLEKIKEEKEKNENMKGDVKDEGNRKSKC